MMDERNARILAVLCSVAGLAVLYFSSSFIEQTAPPVNITSVGMDNVGSSFLVCGDASGTRNSNGNTFLSLTDATGAIDIVIFRGTKTNATISNGQNYCITGTLEEYPAGSGRLEIIAKRVAEYVG
jgi:DNA/RNA endonuclease YhcR with UshA esterase domain